MSVLPPVPYRDQIACVTRELGFRRRVYARRVEQGSMTQAKADLEIRHMEAVLETVEKAATAERLI
jgi:hypothetical protein